VQLELKLINISVKKILFVHDCGDNDPTFNKGCGFIHVFQKGDANGHHKVESVAKIIIFE